MSGLTQKQEAFVKAYILTGNASEAYRQSYNAKNMAENSLNVQAVKQLKNPKIALRLKELQEESKKEFLVSAEQKRKMLWELAMTCAESDEESQKIKNPQAVISAIAEMNKMDGDLASIKIDGNLSTRSTVVIKDMTGKKK
jgi:phage terminase small subunit